MAPPAVPRAAPAFLCGALAVLLGLVLGRQVFAGHLVNTDELFTAERARELRFSGPGAVWDNFQPVSHKPPLQYWLTAATRAVRGMAAAPEAAARLPALLYAVGTAGLVGALARSVSVSRRRPGWAGPLAVGVFVTCPLVLTEGGRALLDMGLAFWTTLTLLAVQRARTAPGWWLTAGTATALGGLQKIPLPAGVLAVVLGLRLLSAEGRAGLRAARWQILGGVALAGVGTLLWPLLQAGVSGGPTGGAFTLEEASRLRGSTRLGARSAWEVWERLTLRWSWGLFALGAAGAGLTVGRPRRGRVIPPPAEIAVVCLGIVLGIALGGFRSVRYVLPAVPGLCALAAWASVRVGNGPERWRRPAGVTVAAALFALGVPAAWHKVRAIPPAAPEQHALAVALGDGLRPGETAVLVREPEDEAEPAGVLRQEFYLFYGNLRVPVRNVTRAEWATAWTPPPAGALGVCRAEDFARARERLPGLEARLTRGTFVLWRVAEPAGAR